MPPRGDLPTAATIKHPPKAVRKAKPPAKPATVKQRPTVRKATPAAPPLNAIRAEDRNYASPAAQRAARVVRKADRTDPRDVDRAIQRSLKKPPEKKKGGGFSPLAVVASPVSAVTHAASDLAEHAAPVAGAAAKVGAKAVTSFGGVPAFVAGKAAEKTIGVNPAKFVTETVQNAPKDAAELAVTTPTSLYKLGDTAIHHPKDLPGMLAQPYIDAAKHPLKAIHDRPVSTYLMAAPAVRMPGRAVGKVARIAGKQSLERAPKTLPGTAVKEQRVASRDAFVNAVQKRQDRKAGSQAMTDADVQRRVDEFFDLAQKHRQNVQASAAKEIKRRTKAKGLEGTQREQAILTHLEGARGGAGKKIERRFAEDFGSTWHRTPDGAIVKPKDATKGVLHKSRADADAIAEKVPFDAVVKPVGERFAVMPRVAVERLHKHQVVGSSKATGAKVMRVSRQAFTGTVLPLSGKWLFGQAGEAGLRTAVAHGGDPLVGPAMSLLRERRVYKALEAERAGLGREWRMRSSGGGQFGLTGTAREFANGKSLAEEFADTGLAKPAAALTKAGSVPGVRHVRRGWRGYSNFVFNTVNGAIEQTAQRAMAGKAIKNSPLMERSIVGLTDKAVHEAAQGLRATEAQVAAGRAVTRMYGQYSKFSPEKRSMLLHWTPFLPWYINAATFLTKVLPNDHPVTTALLADVNAATEEWRKAHGMSLRGGKTRPGFLLGGIPVGKGNQVIRISRYTPFGVGSDPAASAADLALPQLLGPVKNLAGVDWKWQRLKHPGYKGDEFNLGEKVLRAGATAAESMIPGVGVAGRVTGLTGRYVDKKDDPSVLQGKPILPALAKEYNPLAPTAVKEKKRKVKRAKRGGDILAGGGSGPKDILK